MKSKIKEHQNTNTTHVSKNNFVTLFVISLAMCIFSGCEAIEGIFKAGVWSGVLIVVAIVALIIFAITKIGGKSK